MSRSKARTRLHFVLAVVPPCSSATRTNCAQSLSTRLEAQHHTRGKDDKEMRVATHTTSKAVYNNQQYPAYITLTHTLPSQPTKINNDSMPGIEARTIRYLSPASSHSCSSATKTNCAQALSLFLPSKLLTNLQFVLAAIHP